MDRHKLWRDVRTNFASYDESAPEGYEARVRVYIAGRDEPVQVGQVTTNRDPEHPWVALAMPSKMRIADPEASQDKGYPDDRLVFAHESTILRVEIAYVQKDSDAPPRREIGFTVSEAPPES